MAVAAVALMMSLAGCVKTWAMNFARVEGSGDWKDDIEGTRKLCRAWALMWMAV